jgi:putative addiction module killer protein
MFEIIKSEVFDTWLASLKDRQAVQRVLARLDRVRLGNLGDAKFLRDGVSEMRIDYGAGYRLYFTKREGVLVILMCAGDKRTQNKDIEIAIQLAKHWGVEK